MSNPPRESLTAQILAYASAQASRATRGAAVEPLTLGELATRFRVQVADCQGALDSLVDTGQLTILLHAGGRLELRRRGHPR